MRKILPLRAWLAAGLILGPPSPHVVDDLVFCSEDNPAGSDPAQYTTGTDHDATPVTLFNRFVWFERDGARATPALAENQDIGDDGKTYTPHLHKGAEFHSTSYSKPIREFNANDVLFVFQHMLDKNHPFRKACPTKFLYFTDVGSDKNIAKVEKLDEHRVKFTLSEVDVAFIQNLATDVASIQFVEYAGQLLETGKPQQINQKPISTGPFILSRYQKDAQTRFKGNEDYWKPEDVKVDNLIFPINTGAAVRAQKLRVDECQITLNPHPAGLKVLQEAANLKMLSQPSFNLGYIAYSVTHRPFDQLEVCQAPDMAANKQAIIDAVHRGAG